MPLPAPCPAPATHHARARNAHGRASGPCREVKGVARLVDEPPPSECAAALLLLPPENTLRERLPLIGNLQGSAGRMGTSNDGNDEPADGTALTDLVRAVAPSTLHHVFGQEGLRGGSAVTILEAWEKAVSALEHAPPSAGRDVLVELLASLRDLLPRAAGAPAPAALRDRVDAIVARAIVLATDGGLAPPALGAVGVFADAAQGPRAETKITALPGPPAVEGALLQAARGVPALRTVVRAAYEGWPDPEAAAEAEGGHEAAAAAAPAPAPALRLVDEDDAEEPPPAVTTDLRDALIAPIDPAELAAPAARPLVVRVDRPALGQSEMYDRLVDDALDTIRGLARDRWDAPWADRAAVEERMLRLIDGVAVTGDRVVDRILRWWHGRLDLPGPFVTWASVFHAELPPGSRCPPRGARWL